MYAYHLRTGKRVKALTLNEITEPSPGYSSLNRFITHFELPMEGIWKIEVIMDGEGYGDVIISVKNKTLTAGNHGVSPDK